MTGLSDEFQVKAEINLKLPDNQRKSLPALMMKFYVKAHSDSYLQSLNKNLHISNFSVSVVTFLIFSRARLSNL